MLLILILIVILLLSGGGFYGRRSGWGPRGFGGLLLAVLLVILLVWVVNELIMPPLPILARRCAHHPRVMRLVGAEKSISGPLGMMPVGLIIRWLP